MVDSRRMFLIQISVNMIESSKFGPCNVRGFLDTDGITTWLVEDDLVSAGLPYEWEYIDNVWESFYQFGQWNGMDIVDEITVDAFLNNKYIGNISLQVINKDFVLWLFEYFEINNLESYLRHQFDRDLEKLIISSKG